MTPVSVGELNTEVTAEQAPMPAATTAPQTPPDEDLQRLRQATRELARLHDRTRADGFHV